MKVSVELHGHVVGPDDRVLIVVPPGTFEPDMMGAVVEQVGWLLGARALVIEGDDIQVSVVPK